MEKKQCLIIGAIIILIIAAILVVNLALPKGNMLSFEALVQEVVTRSDGEMCLVVLRTTEIYANPLNALGISEDTVLCDANGTRIRLEDFQPGDAVKVTLKNAFVEETPFYYPTVYEIRARDALAEYNGR